MVSHCDWSPKVIRGAENRPAGVREFKVIDIDRSKALRHFVCPCEFRQTVNCLFELYRALINFLNFKIDFRARSVKLISLLKERPVLVAGRFECFVPIHERQYT